MNKKNLHMNKTIHRKIDASHEHDKPVQNTTNRHLNQTNVYKNTTNIHIKDKPTENTTNVHKKHNKYTQKHNKDTNEKFNVAQNIFTKKHTFRCFCCKLGHQKATII